MRRLTIGLLGLLASSQPGCLAPRTSSATIEGVRLHEALTWPAIIPHAGDATYTLEFKGRRYDNFFGVGYVLIPELDAIVFFTKREGRDAYMHIVPVHDGKEVRLNLGDTSLGSGFGRSPEDTSAHFIEKIEGDKFYFVTKAYIDKESGESPRFVVDVKTGELTSLGKVKLTDSRPSGQAKPVLLFVRNN